MKNSALLPTYNRAKIHFDYGKGVYLYDKNKKKYLDFATGIAVNSLGHCHPKVNKALRNQAKKLWHVSNLYEIPESEEYAKKLVENSFAKSVFFCNSGAEAVECAIKVVRKYHNEQSDSRKNKIITFADSFHGRTLATISASLKEGHIDGFAPLLPNFIKAEFNNIDSVKQCLSEDVAGILIEPIQGEGGIKVAKRLFIKELREICNQSQISLIFDEVQCGFGRSGSLFAYELYGVNPDIMTLAKGIGNGLPLGACLVNKKISSYMIAGSHGSTYGGNPLVTKVASTIFDIVSKRDFLKKIKELGDFFQENLIALKQEFPDMISGVRGAGLMVGIRISKSYSNLKIIEKMRSRGLLLAPASNNVIRILPPLIVKKSQIKKSIKIMKKALNEIFAEKFS
jgi:acetylornithine/N-succinyldiaminopimelate aminotransferase